MVSLAVFTALSVQVSPLPRSHSHNDYFRDRPLEMAIENGFSSIEIDVFVVDGRLLVGHDRKDLLPSRTIERLYLQPLRYLVRQGEGRIYPASSEPLWVLVDIKSDGEAAYRALIQTLNEFPELQWRNGAGPVRFVISGDRPVGHIIADKGAYAALDGRWPDLGKGIPADVMPWVSESWLSHFKWLGAGPLPGDFNSKLREMVRKVHAEGRKIRFWGAPDGKPIWELQWKAGVDFLNTDRPAELRRWIVGRDRKVWQ